MPFSIRSARPGDEDIILALLYELAEYEKLTDKYKITREIVARDYLCDRPPIHTDLAYANEKPAGIATWYWTYSTFAAARGIYLEDLFVRPEFRGRGYGKALLANLAKHALAADAGRVEWSVLDWNEPSIQFYESLGAERVKGWHIYRLADDALKQFGT
jgi:GNAT superfamily N-acetyltransferase